ncbi:MAG: RNA helicase [Hangzhou polycipivirus 1]|nr:MAG: RNA helicase [Hangzhou polycipivirus 1]
MNFSNLVNFSLAKVYAGSSSSSEASTSQPASSSSSSSSSISSNSSEFSFDSSSGHESRGSEEILQPIIMTSMLYHSNPFLLVRTNSGKHFRCLHYPQRYYQFDETVKFTKCNIEQMFLPKISDLLNEMVYVKLFDCTRNLIENDFDKYLVELYYRDSFEEEYVQPDFDEPGFHHLDGDIANYHIKLHSKLPYYWNDIRYHESVREGRSLSPFTCHHTRRLLAPTSLMRGIAAGAYSAYEFATIRNTPLSIQQVITKWVIELYQLASNFTISNLILTFLKILNEHFDIQEIFESTKHLFNKAFQYLNSLISKQPSTESNVVPTSLITDLSTLSTIKTSPLAIASAMSSITMIFATIILGRNVRKIENFCTLRNVANTFADMAKMKNGISAMKEMFTNFNNVLYETIFSLLGIESESHLVTLVRESNVIESDENQKVNVFAYARFLTDPSNFIAIQSNSALRKRLEFTYSVLTDIQYRLANELTQLPHQTIAFISTTCNELNKIRKLVAKSSNAASARFTPMWINFVGESHTGKSTFTSIFSKAFINILKRSEAKLGMDFEIPYEDNWFYFVNFSDKYETNYTGQYITSIDDFAQDGPGAVETNSGLKMINWISSIPYSTNQAAIENKGIPFTSKVVISTSNDMSLANRKEIVSVDALVNRMTLCFKFSLDNTCEKHEWFPKKVRIDLMDFKSRDILERNITPERLIAISVERYIEWFRKERHVDSLRVVSDEKLTSIMRNIPILNQTTTAAPGPSELTVPKQIDLLTEQEINQQVKSVVEDLVQTVSDQVQSPEVVPTSRIRCLFGFHPGYTSETKGSFNVVTGYDCTCAWHQKINSDYQKYMEMTDTCDMTIDQFIVKTESNHKYLESLHNSLQSMWHNIKSRIVSFVKSHWYQLITAAVSFAVASAVLWSTTSKILTIPQEEEETNTTATAKYTMNVRKLKTARKAVIPTSGIDNIDRMFKDTFCQNASDIAMEVIIKKGLICKLISTKQINTGLRIAGTAILSNHHFFNMIEEGSKLKIVYNDLHGAQHTVEQIFNRERMYRIPDTDIAIYKCDASLPGAKDIVRHFPENLARATYAKSIVITADPTPIVHTNVIAKPTLLKSTYTMGDEKYSILDSYETNCPVRLGMSGSVLFSVSSQQKHKILGIQTCKNNDGLDDFGYFKPVSQDQLKTALKELKVERYCSDIDSAIVGTSLIIDQRCPPNLQTNSLTYIGTLPKNKQIKQQNVSKIIESVIHDYDSRTQEPSVLSDYDERMREDLRGKPIIFRAIEGFDKPIGCIDTKVLDKAAEQLTIEYDNMLNIRGIVRRVLTPFEMVNGIPQVMLAIDMKTSPGYPFVLERKNTTVGGKFEWFNELKELPEGYGKAYTMRSDLASGLEQAEKLLQQGKQPLFLAYTCLKDETRPLEKITNGKTRAFICLPLHYNLLIRKYFGAFTSAQKMKAGIISSCVGVDPAKDWGRIYDKLSAKNAQWEDFDYANWDQFLHPELVMKVADIINKWYDDGPQNARVRSLLLYNLVHTFIIVKDRLFLKSQGQCSGCAITAELNCLVHDLLMVYVWMKYHQDHGIETNLSEMREYVSMCVYGDDIIMASDPDYQLPFTGKVIAPYMSELGMHITPGDKISTEFEKKDPKDIFFLKRNFIREGGRTYAPLRSDIVENIIQWIHKSDDNLEATRINCETAIQESYMHRKPYFDRLVKLVNERIKQVNMDNPGLNMSPVILDYEALDRRYIGGRFICAGLSESLAIRE